jgi:hypothetical protein
MRRVFRGHGRQTPKQCPARLEEDFLNSPALDERAVGGAHIAKPRALIAQDRLDTSRNVPGQKPDRAAPVRDSAEGIAGEPSATGPATPGTNLADSDWRCYSEE